MFSDSKYSLTLFCRMTGGRDEKSGTNRVKEGTTCCTMIFLYTAAFILPQPNEKDNIKTRPLNSEFNWFFSHIWEEIFYLHDFWHNVNQIKLTIISNLDQIVIEKSRLAFQFFSLIRDLTAGERAWSPVEHKQHGTVFRDTVKFFRCLSCNTRCCFKTVHEIESYNRWLYWGLVSRDRLGELKEPILSETLNIFEITHLDRLTDFFNSRNYHLLSLCHDNRRLYDSFILQTDNLFTLQCFHIFRKLLHFS